MGSRGVAVVVVGVLATVVMSAWAWGVLDDRLPSAAQVEARRAVTVLAAGCPDGRGAAPPDAPIRAAAGSLAGLVRARPGARLVFAGAGAPSEDTVRGWARRLSGTLERCGRGSAAAPLRAALG